MKLRLFRSPRRAACASIAVTFLLIAGYSRSVKAQNGTNPLNIFQNYFVTGDYVVAGWREGTPDGSGYAPGTINIPDTLQPVQPGVQATVPVGADIVAAYLYWASVESNKSSFAGQSGFFNDYPITGVVLGNPNAPTSWSAGGCSGSAQGSKTIRTYRADVRPYLPLDTNTSSVTFGATVARGNLSVRLADSGSNGNTAPIALGATLVVIYRVLSPATPLNAIVLYDGVYAPSNAGLNTSQTMAGFYQPAPATQMAVAKITHIVANGQPNKTEHVYLNNLSQPLPSLYGSLPPFPGRYGSWDNPTWVLSNYGYVQTTDTSETTSVVPSATNSGCVSWGAMILSTPVQDTDNDGLLDVWENNQGYTDAVSGQQVSLPGANPNKKDLFVEVDWLSNLDGSAGPNLHSHLPKQAALDAVGTAFLNQVPSINVHFDLGPGIYTGDPYVISRGTGGNSISEGPLVCTDGASLCAFPSLPGQPPQPAIGWKGGFESIKNSNFQSGGSKSYHYVLFGHSMGSPISYWSTSDAKLADPTIPQLVSIVVNSGNTATITLQSPRGVTYPGQCPGASGCSNSQNSDRISITGGLSASGMLLNGSYKFAAKSVQIQSSVVNSIPVATTSFTISGISSQVAIGTYNYSVEPQLAVTYLGPTSTSGQSEFGGGGDSAITLGLWGADDPPGCVADPSQPLTGGGFYCSNNVGTTQEQTGTLLHELGHTLSLTHGGTYFNDSANPSLPTYELNCKPNYLSVMNYLFQVRGFADGGSLDYSSQTLASLSEPALNESAGIGSAMHQSRWYSTPNALDKKLAHFASSHCDGSSLGPNDVAEVRVDGSAPPGGPLDWNNDLVIDAVNSPGVDVNYNGIIGDAAFSGFDDSQAFNLQQIGAREGPFGSSGGVKYLGGGVKYLGGGVDNDGGGVKYLGGGVKYLGGGVKYLGGGIDQNEDTATSTADPASGLTCTVAIGNAPACVQGSNGSTVTGKSVPLTWTAPGFGQTRTYTIYRATGSFVNTQLVSNSSSFSAIKTLTGAPPTASYTDTSVKNNTTYTYFVTDGNKQGAQSGASNPVVVTVAPH
jgi:hypothetical protein